MNEKVSVFSVIFGILILGFVLPASALDDKSESKVHSFTERALLSPSSLSSILTQTFLDPNPEFADSFGTSLSFSENHVLIGDNGDDTKEFGAGTAYLFDATTGDLLHTFFDPTPLPNRGFGTSVSISGNNVLIGVAQDNQINRDPVAAYLFDATTGDLLQTFLSPTPKLGDAFGTSVSISGNNVLIGAKNDVTESAYLFDATTGDLLQTFLNPTSDVNDNFGTVVSISGNNVLIGNPNDSTSAIFAGAAYLFDATTGDLLHTFLNPTPEIFDNFGFSVSISGNNVLIGDEQDDAVLTDAGAAYLFDATTGDLLHTFLDPNPSSNDRFGFSVSVSGNNVLIGELRGNNAYLFDATTGDLLHTFLHPTSSSNDFGSIVSVLGNNVLIGGDEETIKPQDIGAAYLFIIEEQQDTTSPEISPLSDVTEEATGLDGATVDYDLPTVTDDTDPNPTISCDPASGSLFPIGTTTVICTASDESGNTSESAFSVIVEDAANPAEIFCHDMTINELIASEDYNIIDNRDGSLGTKVNGTNDDDLILASDSGDKVKGKRGDDCIIGGLGDDQLIGNGGSDQMFGNGGNDKMWGNSGDDTIYGNGGNDDLRGNSGDDTIYGNGGNDDLRGNPGNDNLDGGPGNDVLHGGSGSQDTCVSDAEDTNPAKKCEL